MIGGSVTKDRNSGPDGQGQAIGNVAVEMKNTKGCRPGYTFYPCLLIHAPGGHQCSFWFGPDGLLPDHTMNGTGLFIPQPQEVGAGRQRGHVEVGLSEKDAGVEQSARQVAQFHLVGFGRGGP